MPGLPESARVERFVLLVRRRLMLVRAAEGAALGMLFAALVVAVLGRPTTFAAVGTVALLAVGVVVVRVGLGDSWEPGWWRDRGRIAQRVERRATDCRNLLVTAVELPSLGKADTYVGALVMRSAGTLVGRLDAARLFPVRGAVAGLVMSAVLLVALLARPTAGSIIRAPDTGPGGPVVRRFEVRVVPPAYTQQEARVLVNPSRVEALALSRIEVRVEARASAVTIETLDGSREMSAGAGGWSAQVVASADGFIAIEPRDDTLRGPRSIVGLVVTPDHPPRVTLATPGRDLVFASLPDTLPVVVEAEDDFALASLRLQYTAVSGSGERFTFTEHDVPVRLQASSPRSWRATGTWNLRALALEPGDMVVYRAVASDARPGAAAVASESYVLEVAAPGAVAAEGFAADDQRDRYAASQQMIILKTGRLIAARAGLPADSVRESARLLAAEQRTVRAEFVFMMGGELEDAAVETSGTLELDETAEAEAEGDLLAGRLQNQGRVDMMRAIRAMSRASSLLIDGRLDDALVAERTALDNLMRAFSRARFILRALTQRERIDLERRLTGTIGDAAGFALPEAAALPDAVVAPARRLLAELAAWRPERTAAAAARLTDAGVTLLRAEPSEAIRQLVARVEDVTREGDGASAAAVDSLARDLGQWLAARVPAAPPDAASSEAGAIAGAWRDAWRRVRGGERP